MNKYLIAIPSFNCEEQVLRVLNEINLEKFNFSYDVLFVENRSEDQTLEVLKKNLNKLNNKSFMLIQNDKNYGLGGSHKVIFSYALENSYDFVIVLHGDNQAKTAEIKETVNKMDENIDAILGSRFMKNSKREGYSKIRTFGNIVLNLIYSFWKFKLVKDLGSGLNLYRSEMLKDIQFLNFDDSFTFNMDMLLEMIDKKKKIKFVPITWTESDQISNAKALNVGFKTLKKLFIKENSKNNFKFTYKKII